MRVIFYIFITFIGLSLTSIILMPSLFDINSYKKKIQNIVFENTGNNLDITGKINLSIFPIPTLKIKGIKYYKDKKNVLFNSEEVIIVPEIFSLIKGSIVFKSVKLIRPIVFVKVNLDNSNNWNEAFKNKIKVKDTIAKEVEKIEKQKLIKIKNNKISNILNIKSLIMRSAKISYVNKDQTHELKNINLSLDYQEDNNYLIKGSFTYDKKRMEFSHNLSYKNSLLVADGSINNSIINFTNKTQLNLDTFSGKSKNFININDSNTFKILKDFQSFPLEVYVDINFSKQSIDFKKIEVTSKEAYLTGQAIYNKNKKAINLTIQTNQIDLNKFLLNKVISDKDKTNKKKKISVYNKELKVNKEINILLKPYNISIKAKSESIKYNNIQVKDIDFFFVKKDKTNLTVDIKDFFNGKIQANFKINKNNKININLDAYDIEIDQINNLTGHKHITGNLDLLANVSADLKNNFLLLKSLNGDLMVTNKNTSLNTINLGLLKNNILNIKDINSIAKVQKGVFKGNTKIKDSKNSLIINKGILKLPNTNFKFDQGNVLVNGNYNIINNNINMTLNLNDKKNILLSLFKVNFKGDLGHTSKKIDYNKEETKKVLDQIFKRKAKEIIKKKLDKKFDNVIESLFD